METDSIWSWSRTSGRGARPRGLAPSSPRPSHFLSGSGSQCCFNPLWDRAGARRRRGRWRGRAQVPTAPIKPRPWPRTGGSSARRRTVGTEGPRGGGIPKEGSPRSALGPPAAPPSPRRGWVLPKLGGRGVATPPAGPPRSQAEREGPEVQEEGEREKFEKRAARGEPDKPGPGRARAATWAGPAWGPGAGGGLRRGGSGPGSGWGAPRPVRPGSAGRFVTRHPRPPAPTRAQPLKAGAPPSAPPRAGAPNSSGGPRRGRGRCATGIAGAGAREAGAPQVPG